jgi:hypothetical protein
MGREQMRNLEVFKIGGTQVNEFEYQKRQGEMTEQSEHHPDEVATAPKRPTQAERVKQLMAEAHKKVEKKRKREAAKAGRSKKIAASSKPTARPAASGVLKRASQAAGKKKQSVSRGGSTRATQKGQKK